MTKLISVSIAIAVGCGLLALAQAPPNKPELKYSVSCALPRTPPQQ